MSNPHSGEHEGWAEECLEESESVAAGAEAFLKSWTAHPANQKEVDDEGTQAGG